MVILELGVSEGQNFMLDLYDQRMREIREDRIPLWLDRFREKHPKGDVIYNILKKMLRTNAKDRPSPRDLKNELDLELKKKFAGYRGGVLCDQKHAQH
jgi:hypothetical protein